MSKIDDLLPLVPFGKTKLRELVKSGDFPAPVKLNDRCVAWRNADVLAWLAMQDEAA